MRKQIKVVRSLCRSTLTFIYSVYFNLRVLPLKQALHLPFYCNVWPTILRNKTGKVVLDCANVQKYMIRLGVQRTPILLPRDFIWNNEGLVVFKGKCHIGHHSMIRVCKEGVLEIGNQVGLNTGCRIVCQQKITFNTKVRVSWDCQFYDTNFHPLIDMVAHKPVKLCAPIVIGRNVWIGHNVIISKGVKLADGIIVSSGSVVKNIFKTPNCIVSGNPAVKIGDGYEAEFPDL